jgi:hypothetical protein
MNLKLAAAFLLLSTPALFAQSSVVTLSKDASGNYTLIRNGKPFYINGAGGSSRLQTLAECGGNSIRTWGIDSMEEKVDGKRLIDRAQELNLAVTAGIWLKHEGQGGFSWSNQADLDKQRDEVRAAVRKYKDSPALLIWGMGNEMEGDKGDNVAIYKELNVLAGIIKEEDKNHPVMTVIASAVPQKVKGILDNCPNIDILGVNAYAGGGGAAESAKQTGWKKPFILTEFGPSGAWEVSKTPWGAPREPSSWEKAKSYYGTVESIKESKDIVLGSYVFLWGNKMEETTTWYGMFLDTGEKLPTVDVMTHEWTGHWPANRSPKITKFDSPLDGKVVAPGSSVPASITAEDPENDPLTYEWMVVAEQTVHGQGGSAEPIPPSFPECTTGQNGPQATIKVPTKPGDYRLFVTVKDGKGGASKDNIPFEVK